MVTKRIGHFEVESVLVLAAVHRQKLAVHDLVLGTRVVYKLR